MKKTSNDNYVPALRFHWLTPFYDAVVATTTRERRFKTALINQAQFQARDRVLDLGAGTGTLTIWIRQRHAQVEVIGVDGDPAIVSLATSKAIKMHASVKFDRAMSYELPYPDAHFDKVVSSLFFHHLSPEKKERTATELLRVLKPGGELHIADWGRASNALMRGLFLFVQVLDGFENTRDNVAGGLIPLFQQAGFVEVKQRQAFSTMFGTLALYSAMNPG